MIVQTIDLPTFRQAFCDYGRSDQFSHEALKALFDFLEDCSESCGKPCELDVIGICCDFAEYGSVTEAAEEFGWQPPERDTDVEDDGEPVQSDDEYSDECDADARSWLEDRTVVLELLNGGIVIQSF